jgi:hypothetical protein
MNRLSSIVDDSVFGHIPIQLWGNGGQANPLHRIPSQFLSRSLIVRVGKPDDLIPILLVLIRQIKIEQLRKLVIRCVELGPPYHGRKIRQSRCRQQDLCDYRVVRVFLVLQHTTDEIVAVEMHKVVSLFGLVDGIEEGTSCSDLVDVQLYDGGDLVVSCDGECLEFHSPDFVGVEEEVGEDCCEDFKEFGFGEDACRCTLRLEWEIEKFAKEVSKCDIADTAVRWAMVGSTL